MFEFVIDGDELPLAGFQETQTASTSVNTTTEVGSNSSTNDSSSSGSTNIIELECGNGLLSVRSEYSQSGSYTGDTTASRTFLSGTSTYSETQSTGANSSGFVSGSFLSVQAVSGFSTTLNVVSSVSGSSSTSRNLGTTVNSPGGGVTTNSTTETSVSTVSGLGETETTVTTSGLAAVNTTTMETVTATYTTWVLSEIETTVLTATVVTETVEGDTEFTYWTTTESTSTVDWPVSSFTTLDGEETITEAVTSTITSEFKTVTTYITNLVGDENCRGLATVFEPEECAVLFVAGPMTPGAVFAFCDVYASTSADTIYPLYDTTSTTTSSSTTDAAFGRTEWTYVPGTATVDGFPQTFFGMAGVEVPDSLPGYQPWYALGVTDDVFESYTIVVASTLSTDTPEYSQRSQGFTVARGNITQVLTLNTADEFIEGPAADTTSVPANGGFGWVGGPATAVYQPGVYRVTTISSDGATAEGTSFLSESQSELLGDGEVLGIITELAVSGLTVTWGEGVEKRTFVELPCDALY